MLSPPSSRWSPVAIRSIAGGPPAGPAGPARNRLKSVVPPPMSQTRIVPCRSPSAASVASAPGVAGGVVEPGVERGLRLLQQADGCRVAGQPRRFARQRLRRFVERGGNGDDDPLRFERKRRVAVRDGVVPRGPQIAEVGRARLRRRELELGRNLVRAERQEARFAVDARVREPGLGRVDHPARLTADALAGQRPDEVSGGFLERQRRDRIELPVGDLARRRIAEERREQGARADRARGVELRDLQHADRRGAVGEVDPGQRAVGRSEVDADGVAGRRHPRLPGATHDPATQPDPRPGLRAANSGPLNPWSRRSTAWLRSTRTTRRRAD